MHRLSGRPSAGWAARGDRYAPGARARRALLAAAAGPRRRAACAASHARRARLRRTSSSCGSRRCAASNSARAASRLHELVRGSHAGAVEQRRLARLAFERLERAVGERRQQLRGRRRAQSAARAARPASIRPSVAQCAALQVLDRRQRARTARVSRRDRRRRAARARQGRELARPAGAVSPGAEREQLSACPDPVIDRQERYLSGAAPAAYPARDQRRQPSGAPPCPEIASSVRPRQGISSRPRNDAGRTAANPRSDASRVPQQAGHPPVSSLDIRAGVWT